MQENKPYAFQVNMKGMISLLSEHLYSNANTFIRELLQNAVDAIRALQHIDEQHIGKISFTLPSPGNNSFVFQDNGIGLKESEIHQFLSVIGESSKTKNIEETYSYIGKFGIGLLSCFVVSDSIVVETRSAYDKSGFRWTAEANGQYQLEPITEEIPIGTRVILVPKESYNYIFTEKHMLPQIRYYGDALPVSIYQIQGETSELIHNAQPLWLQESASKSALLDYGRSLFHLQFLDAIPFETTAGKCKGVLYIIPHKTQFSVKQSHRIYLKNMFLTETENGILPSWAFFVRLVMNSQELSATASRESFMQNDTLREVKKEIALVIKDYFRKIRDIDFQIYYQIIQTHFLHLKAMAIEDNEFLDIFIDDLPFETNRGYRSFKQIKEINSQILYCADFEDFKQIQRISAAQDLLVVNAGYTFDEEILKKIGRNRKDVSVELMSPSKLLSSFKDLKPEEEIGLASFIVAVENILREFECECEIKHFTPLDTAAIYTKVEQSTANATIKQIKSTANPFSNVLNAFSKGKTKPAKFCLNFDNQLVQNILVIEDEFLLKSIIEVLYVQAIIMGKYQVTEKEMTIFNEALNNLIVMGMTNFVKL